jgi:colicin import membrane protein
MKTGWIISAIVHAGLLAWGLISFTARPLEAKPTDAMPVDIISTSEFSQLTAGVKNAKQVETPKPLADKIGEPKPADEITPKVADKPEIKTASAQPEHVPMPEPKPVEAKPEKKPEPKVDPIADKLKRDEQQRKLAEAKAKAEVKKKPPPPQPKFDPNQIAALLDRRDAQRTTATGNELGPPSLGSRTGAAPKLSQSELDAMRAKLMQLWNPPVGVRNPEELIVKIRIHLRRDGTLADWPIVIATGKGEQGAIARESAVRAIIRGQPFSMLSPATYENWKEIEITFDPRDMFRG